MRRDKLDKIDRKILEMLQGNGRMTNVELAQSVGISPPPCLRRVRALEEAGFIKGYHADIDGASLGYAVTIFAMIKLTHQADKDLVEFEKMVLSLPEVRTCHLISGDFDFILKVVTKDWDSYQEILTKKLTTAPNISSIRSSLCVKVIKDFSGVPVE